MCMWTFSWEKDLANFRGIALDLLFIDDTTNNKSRSIAPDLLLIDDTTNLVIPVEIKCLVSELDVINGKFLREYKLEKKTTRYFYQFNK